MIDSMWRLPSSRPGSTKAERNRPTARVDHSSGSGTANAAKTSPLAPSTRQSSIFKFSGIVAPTFVYPVQNFVDVAAIDVRHGRFCGGEQFSDVVGGVVFVPIPVEPFEHFLCIVWVNVVQCGCRILAHVCVTHDSSFSSEVLSPPESDGYQSPNILVREPNASSMASAYSSLIDWIVVSTQSTSRTDLSSGSPRVFSVIWSRMTSSPR